MPETVVIEKDNVTLVTSDTSPQVVTVPAAGGVNVTSQSVGGTVTVAPIRVVEVGGRSGSRYFGRRYFG